MLRIVLSVALVFVAGAADVRAQGTGRSMDIDTSIRASGMGGAGAAVGWGEPSVWGNPAAIALVRGIRLEHGRTRLVPGLPGDVYLESDRWLLGGMGVGVQFAGAPGFGPGEIRLDYGLSQGFDPSGNPTGTFASFEEIEAFGVALSIAGVLDGIQALRGRPSRWQRFGDVAAGFQQKHTTISLGPGPAYSVSGDCLDWGVLLRVSPLEALPLGPVSEWVLLDGSYGEGVLNANDESFAFSMTGQPNPPSRIRRTGWAFATGVRAPWARRAKRNLLDALLGGLSPLVQYGRADDHERVGAGNGPTQYEVDREGYEVTLLNLATIRGGHVTDLLSDINGDTDGWGVNVPIGPWGGVRFDQATIPQSTSSGLPDVERRGWSAWIDPLAIRRDWKASH
jgi:hypothetical protein